MTLKDAEIRSRIVPEMLDMWTGPRKAGLVVHQICIMIGISATAPNMDRVRNILEAMTSSEEEEGALPVLDTEVVDALSAYSLEGMGIFGGNVVPGCSIGNYAGA